MHADRRVQGCPRNLAVLGHADSDRHALLGAGHAIVPGGVSSRPTCRARDARPPRKTSWRARPGRRDRTTCRVALVAALPMPMHQCDRESCVSARSNGPSTSVGARRRVQPERTPGVRVRSRSALGAQLAFTTQPPVAVVAGVDRGKQLSPSPAPATRAPRQRRAGHRGFHRRRSATRGCGRKRVGSAPCWCRSVVDPFGDNTAQRDKG